MSAGRENRSVLLFVSVVVSMLLYFNVNSQINQKATRSVVTDLDIINVPDGLALPTTKEKVTIEVTGPTNALDQLSSTTWRPYVDLRGAKEGTQNFKVYSNLPKDSPITANPQSKTLYLEPIETQRRTVTIEAYGLLSDQDILLAGKSATPRRVILKGPRSQVDQVKRVVARLNLADIKGNQQQVTSKLEFYDANSEQVTSVTADPSEVTILVSTTPRPQTRTILIQPQFAGVPAFGYKVKRVEVEPNQIDVGGIPEALSRLSVINTSEIDLNEAKDTKEVDATLELPAGIKTNGRQSVRVRVIIEKSSNATPPSQ